jgi:hypothetical protein
MSVIADLLPALDTSSNFLASKPSVPILRSIRRAA